MPLSFSFLLGKINGRGEGKIDEPLEDEKGILSHEKQTLSHMPTQHLVSSPLPGDASMLSVALPSRILIHIKEEHFALLKQRSPSN